MVLLAIRKHLHLSFCFILSLIFLPAEMSSITYPITPVAPKVPDVEGDVSNPETPSRKEKARSKQDIQIIAFLGSGDEITGKVYMPRSVDFKHYKNGLIYKKTVPLRDIFSIEILSFRKTLLRKSKNAVLYEFKPDRVKITTRDKIKGETRYRKTFFI